MGREQRESLMLWRQQLQQLGLQLQQQSQSGQWALLARIDYELACCLRQLHNLPELRLQLAEDLNRVQQQHKQALALCAAAREAVAGEMAHFNECREGSLAYQESQLWR